MESGELTVWKNEVIQILTGAKSPENNTVNSILADNDSIVWIASKKGLIRVIINDVNQFVSEEISLSKTNQTIEISKIASADAVTADIFFTGHVFGDFVGAVKFDNAVVVPEPASLTLLAMGGLALLRRKK